VSDITADLAETFELLLLWIYVKDLYDRNTGSG
jgi:hypothetical protein